MDIFSNFESDLLNWLRENGANEVEGIVFGLDYEYCITDHTICIGTENHAKSDEWFKEYLKDKGCVCEDIPSDILAFLHEVGHSCTIHKLMAEEDDFLDRCAMIKADTYNWLHMKRSYMNYWDVADELAANEWLIDFISKKRNKIDELCRIWDAGINGMVDGLLSMMESCA